MADRNKVIHICIYDRPRPTVMITVTDIHARFQKVISEGDQL